MPPSVEHVFVLMLENRSFDHLFGFSGLTGTDAATGASTAVDGLTGQESNRYANQDYRVTRSADFATDVDPGHEFEDVLDQLCGPGVRYVPPYPPIDRSGFVDSYGHHGGGGDLHEIMRCFDTHVQLPVLDTLAREYAICDRWFSSMPGPTWPNRMFVHAASSAGLDHSPSTAEIVEWEAIDGFSFPNGTIFEALTRAKRSYGLYSGDVFPMVAALKGITVLDVHRIDDLVSELQEKTFRHSYVFIEPSYNVLNDYRNSSSQHPKADVRDGEALVKTVYEAIRGSAIWERSLLLILWDEHGGFYDHVTPPRALAPGDTRPRSKYNRSGFTFEQYGVRTPAIVVSPLVPRHTIDHRVYDHASVPATLEALFGLPPLTKRDAGARHVLPLLSLASPRSDTETPTTLPTPPARPSLAARAVPAPSRSFAEPPAGVSRPEESVNGGTLPVVLGAALRQQLALHPEAKAEILAAVAKLQTREDAQVYLATVQADLAATVPVPTRRRRQPQTTRRALKRKATRKRRPRRS